MMDWESKSVEELRELVAYHDLRYWTLNSPEISDAEYDRLVETLRRKSPKDKALEKLRSIVVSSSKIHHAVPMLSLDKAYSFEEILAWADKHCRTPDESLAVSPKYDGVAGDWSDGVLSSRGDGLDGDDLSDKLTLITLEPQKGVPYPLQNCRESVRREILMTTSEFDSHPGDFKTPRAAAAGLLGRNEADEKYTLTFVDYRRNEIILKRRELTAARWEKVRRQFASLPYPQDGMVIRLADDKYAQSLGSTGHHPHGAIAFKFGQEGIQTTITDIIWQVNRQDVTPVAEVAPVEINGRTVSRVTLHNGKYVQENDVRIGDTVTLILAGDVIPKVVAVEPGDSRKEAMIEKCPCCGKALSWRGARLVCENQECEAVVKAMFLDFADKLGLKGFGKSGCDWIYSSGARTREEMASLLLTARDCGVPASAKIGKALIEKLSAPLLLGEAQKLVACDVFMLGPIQARKLTGRFSLETIFRHAGDEQFFVKSGCLEKNMDAAGIAEGIAKRKGLWQLIERLARPSNAKMLRSARLTKAATGAAVPKASLSIASTSASTAGHVAPAAPSATGGLAAVNTPGFPPLNLATVKNVGGGKTICLTGRMPWLRADLYQACIAAGYVPQDKYSSAVSLVVYADLHSGSRKMRGAVNSGKLVEYVLDFVKRIGAI
ncbi:MAG: hypothetical protein IJS15_03605 [Victivallales bacterium]|nr:hypothetical protein [Victivallales bacterium]